MSQVMHAMEAVPGHEGDDGRDGVPAAVAAGFELPGPAVSSLTQMAPHRSLRSLVHEGTTTMLFVSRPYLH